MNQDEIEAFRLFNQGLRDKYAEYFGEEPPVKMGEVKKKLLDECRRVIDATPFGQELSDEDATVLRKITGWHYARIRHVSNPKYFADKRYIEVLQDDGEWITHSWRKTIDPSSEWRELQKSMRQSVAPFAITKYREKAEKQCVCCGTHDDLTVDHKSRSFDELMQTFVADLGYTPEVRDGEHNQGRVIADDAVLKAWIEFHDFFADFQILCRSCNASKGKKSLHSV